VEWIAIGKENTRGKKVGKKPKRKNREKNA
jgi:hypothetical protein